MVEKKRQDPPAAEPAATAEPAPPVEPAATVPPAVDMAALIAELKAAVRQEVRAELEAAGGLQEEEPEPEPEPAVRYVLVLATGNRVEAPSTVATEHYDEEAGLTVPVVSSFRVPAEV